MLNVYIANKSKQSIGGGWSFLYNLNKGLKGKVNFVNTIKECDIYFIAGATMTDKDDVKLAKSMGKKIILRIDNIPRNSRNRNTGTSRLLQFAQLADKIIFQCSWSQDYVGYWLYKNGVNLDKSTIIYNGVDTSIFKPDGERMPKQGNKQYLYSRYSRDENKRWEECWFKYQYIQRQEPEANLWIVGRFSPEQAKYNFDFYNNEKFHYWGIVDKKETMARIYRGADVLIAPYYMDCFSNTILEAKACGIDLMINKTGGNKEIQALSFDDLKLERMADDYLNLFLSLI